MQVMFDQVEESWDGRSWRADSSLVGGV